jgi:hypothetical protein
MSIEIPKWINTKDQLPHPWQKVFVRGPNVCDVICEYYEDKNKLSKSGNGRFLVIDSHIEYSIDDIEFWYPYGNVNTVILNPDYIINLRNSEEK